MKLADGLRLVEELKKCASSQEVGTAFASAVAPHGYTMVSCGGSRDTPAGRVWDFFFNTWPPEVLLEYQKNEYVRHDMLPAVARLSAMPFTWVELLRDRKQTPKQIEFHNRVRGSRSCGRIRGANSPSRRRRRTLRKRLPARHR